MRAARAVSMPNRIARTSFRTVAVAGSLLPVTSRCDPPSPTYPRHAPSPYPRAPPSPELRAPPPSAKHVVHDEPDIRRTLCEPAHVPRKPVLAVRDEDAQRTAGGNEALLQRTLNPVQHRV